MLGQVCLSKPQSVDKFRHAAGPVFQVLDDRKPRGVRQRFAEPGLQFLQGPVATEFDLYALSQDEHLPSAALGILQGSAALAPSGPS